MSRWIREEKIIFLLEVKKKMRRTIFMGPAMESCCVKIAGSVSVKMSNSSMDLGEKDIASKSCEGREDFACSVPLPVPVLRFSRENAPEIMADVVLCLIRDCWTVEMMVFFCNQRQLLC